MEEKQLVLVYSDSTVFIHLFPLLLAVTHLIQLIKHKIITVTNEFNQEYWSKPNLGIFSDGGLLF